MLRMPINSDNPFSNIIRGVEADVLFSLCTHPMFDTSTGIARHCGRSRSEVRVVLNYLVSREVVSQFQDGSWKFFKLNRDHPLHDPILQFAKAFETCDSPRATHAFDAVNK